MGKLPATPLLVTAVLLIAWVAFLGGRAAEAHGNPEVAVDPNPAPAGGTITIEGKEFEEDDEISLTLEGVSGSLALAMVTADAEGSFHVEVTLPAGAVPGAYQVRAEGSDATALADFRITAAAGGGQPLPEHETAIGFHRGGPAGEVIALSIVLGAFAVAGLILVLVRERATR